MGCKRSRVQISAPRLVKILLVIPGEFFLFLPAWLTVQKKRLKDILSGKLSHPTPTEKVTAQEKAERKKEIDHCPFDPGILGDFEQDVEDRENGQDVTRHGHEGWVSTWRIVSRTIVATE